MLGGKGEQEEEGEGEEEEEGKDLARAPSGVRRSTEANMKSSFTTSQINNNNSRGQIL